MKEFKGPKVTVRISLQGYSTMFNSPNGVTHVYSPQTEERRLQMALSTLISDAKINAKERTRASQETVEKSKAQLITVRSKSSALSLDLHHCDGNFQ